MLPLCFFYTFFPPVFLNHSNSLIRTRGKMSPPLSLVVLQYLGKLTSSHLKASALDWFSEVSSHAAAAFLHFFLCFVFFNHYISKACLFCPPSGTSRCKRSTLDFSEDTEKKVANYQSLFFQPPATAFSP